MNENDAFEKARKKKTRFSLRARLTLFVGIVVLVSILLSIGLLYLLGLIFPALSNVPQLLQLNILSFSIAVIVARFMVKIFCDPIQDLREGMRKVANGDFSVRLKTKSTSSEIQEMMSGFNMMAKELESTEILQSDFVSNVSHEFKTPINAIEGYTTLLQNTENIDETENYYIEKILFNTKRLSSLVSNILLLSKIENLTFPTRRELYRLDEQVRETIVALESAWEPKEIDFDVDLAEINYCGNDTLIYHVWLNLMSNAVKFSDHGGEVKIRLYENDNKIYFIIENQGPLLSDDARKHIFDKFYQEDTSHKEEGNGLGLTLVKRILSTINGEITAENIENYGCRFTVVLNTEN